jgi:hypothetical protein
MRVLSTSKVRALPFRNNVGAFLTLNKRPNSLQVPALIHDPLLPSKRCPHPLRSIAIDYFESLTTSIPQDADVVTHPTINGVWWGLVIHRLGTQLHIMPISFPFAAGSAPSYASSFLLQLFCCILRNLTMIITIRLTVTPSSTLLHLHKHTSRRNRRTTELQHQLNRRPKDHDLRTEPPTPTTKETEVNPKEIQGNTTGIRDDQKGSGDIRDEDSG